MFRGEYLRKKAVEGILGHPLVRRENLTLGAGFAFAERLRARGYAAVYASLEESQGVEDIDRAEPIWISSLSWRAGRQLPDTEIPE